MPDSDRLKKLELMRRKFLAEVKQLLADVPEDEVKVEVDLYPSEPDLLRELEEEAVGLDWVSGTNMGRRWFSSIDVVSDDVVDNGDTTVYL